MKIALVHDFMNQYGGAERVLEVIKEIYPEAPVFTSFYESSKLPERMRSWEIKTPRFGGFPIFRKISKLYTFFLPLAFESFDLRNFDIIISSTASFAKGLILRPNQLHICYCHTPPRFMYHYETEIDRHKKSLYRPFLLFIDHYLRLWDFSAAQRVDFFLTNSINTRKRIAKFYRKEAKVIYPPVSLSIKSNLSKSEKSDPPYFLIVSRLAAYKKIDLAIKACNNLGFNLKIIGEGREESRLKKIAHSNISFLGKVEDIELAKNYNNCQAVTFPGEDDFGIVPIEAMSWGKPVIAYAEGGALETVVPGKTGELFHKSTVPSLEKILKNFKVEKYKKVDCLNQARKFDKDNFKKEFKDFIDSKWREKNNA